MSENSQHVSIGELFYTHPQHRKKKKKKKKTD